MLKELKKDMEKIEKMIYNQNENFNKQKTEKEILELKSTITNEKLTRGIFKGLFQQA